MNKKKEALFIGRFQPLHNGHIFIINNILKECENVSIIIGSVQEPRTEKNPFNFAERVEMLYRYYEKKEGLWDRIHVSGLCDINNLEKWPRYVLDYIKKPVDIFYTGSEEDGSPFKKEQDLTIKIINREKDVPEDCLCSATQIRNLIKQNNKIWEKFVPKCNKNLIINTIKNINRKTFS